MNEYVFKPRAQLLLQLGEQLIKNENVAIMELVKNSYDADAKKVKIKININDEDSKYSDDIVNSDYIEILDDGWGMNKDDITNVWLEPGNNHKKKMIEKLERTPLGRLPIGEKGIGRFGVHKLGKKITLISKKKDCKEVVFKIDWSDFEEADYLSDVGIQVVERESQMFLGDKTGTYLYISDLFSKWTRTKLRNVKKNVESLNSPFDGANQFKVIFKTNRIDWVCDMLDFNKVKEYALYYGEFNISGDSVSDYQYKFTPYETMKSLKSRNVIVNEPEKMILIPKKNDISEGLDFLENTNTEKKMINLDKYKIGKIKIVIYAFDRDTEVKRLMSFSNQIATYLNENGGVRVFRDKLRVMDYGEPESDWLELDNNRINNPSARLGNRNILAAVYLDRASSTDLKEKANREGFVENNAFLCFREAIKFAINIFTSYRNSDKENVRKKVESNKKEPLEAKTTQIKSLAEKNINDINIKTEFIEKIDDIKTEVVNIKNNYLRTSSLGLNYGVIIHEIEKIIGELSLVVEEEAASERIRKLVNHLSLLIGNYSEVMRSRPKAKYKLSDIVRQSIEILRSRLERHAVEVDDSFANIIDCYADVSYNIIISATINIVDNSIYWLDYNDISNKKLFFKTTEEIEGYSSIIIADNGFGYKLSCEDAIKPFVSRKYNGIGLGLSIVNEIMNSQNGIIFIPENNPDDIVVNGYKVSIPNEFKTGAITILAFRKENL